MSSLDVLAPLLAPLVAVQRIIEELDDQGVIIGGVAASLLGQPRLTADVDAMVLQSIDDLPRLFTLVQGEGLQPRLADALNFARRSRVLLLQHAQSGIDVDISLGVLPFEVDAVERSVVHQIGSEHIRLPTPEDLIVLKAVAHRPKDLLDIEAIVAAQSHLDRDHIAFWVRQFAELLELPEIWTDLDRLLSRTAP